MRAALGLDEPSFGPAPAIEQGESPDTFLISARDLLPLRLCTFAPLRSFLPTSLTRGLAPTPLAKALGAEVNDSQKEKFRLARSQRRGT